MFVCCHVLVSSVLYDKLRMLTGRFYFRKKCATVLLENCAPVLTEERVQVLTEKRVPVRVDTDCSTHFDQAWFRGKTLTLR